MMRYASPTGAHRPGEAFTTSPLVPRLREAIVPLHVAPHKTEACTALLHKLDRLSPLDADDKRRLGRALGEGRWLAADAHLAEQGRPSDSVYVIVDGLACRYKMLADGRRQILGFLIPGDLCDHQYTVCNTPDHSVVLLTPSYVVRMSLDRLAILKAECPRLSHALMVAALVDNAISREWLLSIGQRSAIEKVAHLLCELRERYAAIGGVASDGSFAFLINQAALGDTIGLSLVHVNRTLMRLRQMGLIVLRQRRLVITDLAHLAGIAEFNQTYLRPRPNAR